MEFETPILHAKHLMGLSYAADKNSCTTIFATSNSTDRLSKPLLSRFTVFEIPEYSYPEFEAISVRIIKKLPRNTVIQIASSVWKTASRDIRDVLKIAKLCRPSDGEEEITRLMPIHKKYHRTGNDYNYLMLPRTSDFGETRSKTS
jgi:hypothetical protein